MIDDVFCYKPYCTHNFELVGIYNYKLVGMWSLLLQYLQTVCMEENIASVV